MLRLTAGGAIDVGFGNGLSAFTGEAQGIAPLGETRVLVGGWRRTATVPPLDEYFVALLDAATGNLVTNTSFGGGDGMAEIGFGSNARAEAMALAPDGRIVLAGW